MRRSQQVAVVVFTALLLSGCITHRLRNPHNDVLIFGTTTAIALDVGAPIQNGGVPEFTLGYKRHEAVWMPLKPSVISDPRTLEARVRDCVAVVQSKIVDEIKVDEYCRLSVALQDKYLSYSSGINAEKGGNTQEIDTYSVFASLGAKGGLSFSSASGNLAQFFATGIAAQRLGANPNVSSALNVKEADASVARAIVEAGQTPNLVRTLIESGEDPAKSIEIARDAEVKKEREVEETKTAATCVAAWKGTAPASLVEPTAIALVTSRVTFDRLVRELTNDDSAREAILRSCE